MAKKTIEDLAKEIYNECKAEGEEVTMEEAQEMAKMEMGCKEIKNYTQAQVEKKKTKREVKLDDEKVTFIQDLFTVLSQTNAIDIVVVNPQKEITFKIGENDYSLSLIKHRQKK